MTPLPDSATRSRPGYGSDRSHSLYSFGDVGPTPIRLVGTNFVSLAVTGTLDARHLIPLRHRIRQLGAAGYRTINVDVDPTDATDTAAAIHALRSIQDDAARSSITVTINGGNEATT